MTMFMSHENLSQTIEAAVAVAHITYTLTVETLFLEVDGYITRVGNLLAALDMRR
jgi:hypothetical protein